MSAANPTKKPSGGNTSETGLIIICDSKQIHAAAKNNPKLAEILKKTPVQDLNDDEKVFNALKPNDLDDILEKWQEVMRFEAKNRTGTPLDGSSWLDSFSIIKLGEPSKSDHQISRLRFESLEEKDEEKDYEDGTKHAEAEPRSRSYQHILDPDFIKSIEAIGLDDPVHYSMMRSSKTTDGFGSMTPAENLKKAVDADKFPTDPLTRQQFGFAKVNTHEEETCVLGLYIGLLILLPRTPTLDTLQEWVAKNELAQGIQESYESQLGESGYFNWFLKNKRFFNQDYVNPNGPRAAPEDGSCVDQDLFDKLTR